MGEQRGATTPVILIAEDDDADYVLTERAFREAKLVSDLRRVRDGGELLDYLHQRGAYAEPGRAPRPALVLLDLNMPGTDGRQALSAVKSDPGLRTIPVVVLTTSSHEADIVQTYDLGVNSFIRKPVNFADMVEVVRTFTRYWFAIVELPDGEN